MVSYIKAEMQAICVSKQDPEANIWTRDENGGWGRLHNEKFHCLYRSSNIVRVIKTRRLRWAGIVARMEGVKSAFKMLTGAPARKRPLGRPGVDGRTILEWILKK